MMYEQDDSAFRGNSNLKKKGEKIKWTKERIRELKKCKEDIIYFICKYCKVVTLDKGIQPFELYDYQRDLVKLIENNRFIISCQSRQSGKCCNSETLISIRNKKNGKIEKIPIGDFHDRIAATHKKQKSDTD